MKISWKRIWYFIWKEDSLASWIVNIILAFVIIKFLIYPGLGFVLDTPYPIVAVVSGSMEHDITKQYYDPLRSKGWTGKYSMCGNEYDSSRRVNFDTYWDECGEWYEGRNISKEEFSEFPLSNGFNKGDIIVLYSKKNVEVGDVIVFWANRPEPIIHRVVDVNELDQTQFLTKGDNNGREDGWSLEERVIGKALFKIPMLGWIKILFTEFIYLFIGG